MASTIGQTWAGKLRLAWNGSKGAAILRSLAAVLVDRAIDWGADAITKRFPVQLDGSAGEAAALAMLANERGYIADPNATALTTATNLQNAQNFARLSGTPIGLLVALSNAGFTGAVVVQVNGLAWTINTTPTASQLSDLATMTSVPSWVTRTVLPNANPAIPASTDGRPAIAALTIPWWTLGDPMDGAGNQFASRFAVVFPSTATDPQLGTAANLQRLQRAIAKWKPAKASCAGIWRLSSGGYYGDGTTYGDGGTYGGASTFYPGA